MIMPRAAKNRRNCFLTPHVSPIDPRTGAIKAIKMLATELEMPRLKVLLWTSMPLLQNCLKKMGKNPAMTVVA